VSVCLSVLFFFFQAEDGIRDLTVTGVQTCALPICRRPARRAGRSGDRPADRARDRRGGGARPDRPGGPGRPGGARAATRRVARVRRRREAVAPAARGRAPGGEPGGGGARRGRNRSAARPIREDLLRAAPPGHGELRPGREHGEAGHRRGGRAGRRGSAPEGLALRTPAPPRWAALAACLSLACWHGPTPAPLLPVAVLPLDAYGGAIYVPAVINGDSAWPLVG